MQVVRGGSAFDKRDRQIDGRLLVQHSQRLKGEVSDGTSGDHRGIDRWIACGL